jgi:hypothetical protein
LRKRITVFDEKRNLFFYQMEENQMEEKENQLDKNDKELEIILLNAAGIQFTDLNQLDGLTIYRELLLSDSKYEEIKKLIPTLKTKYSSSIMTSLQKNAEKVQKWPLLNIVRQILARFHFRMVPIRKSDGYTLDGVKKYKRLFRIERKPLASNDDNDLSE